MPQHQWCRIPSLLLDLPIGTAHQHGLSLSFVVIVVRLVDHGEGGIILQQVVLLSLLRRRGCVGIGQGVNVAVDRSVQGQELPLAFVGGVDSEN